MNPPEQTETEEPEINPRTGLPYKQSAKLRAQKLKWRNANRELVNKHTRAYQERNKAEVYKRQVEYMRRNRERHRYLLELFNEALQKIEWMFKTT